MPADPCNPSTLANEARCFDCLGGNGALLEAIRTYLLCLWVQKEQNPN